MLFLTSGLLGACCGMNIKAEINFINVDSELDYESYLELLDIGQGLEMTLDIPEGFDHSGLSITLNGIKEIPYEVIYDDPTVEEQYSYTTAKTIKFSIAKATTDFTLDIDMTTITRKSFEINVSNSITSQTTDNKNSNLYAVSIDPNSLDRLTKLDSTNVLAKREVVNNKVTVFYDEYIALCYEKQSGKTEYSAFYTDVNYFTNKNDILHLGNIDYCQYKVAKSGSNYYHLYNNINTRLFYIGRIQEGFNIYSNIPTYVAPQGFVLENDENKFSLLTNSSKYNSDLLTIKVFAPTEEEYDEDSDSMEKLNDTVLKQLNSIETLHHRYDRYDMYIGDNITEDEFISNDKKNTLPSTLYVSIGSNIGNGERIESILKFHLLHYEKQSSDVEHVHDISDIIYSDKGTLFFKIDRDLIKSYIDSLYDGAGYETGNAILYVQIDPEYKEKQRMAGTFKYSYIGYPVRYDGTWRGIDYDYYTELFIKNDEEIDYGFVDFQAYAEDCVYFLTSRLYDETYDETEGRYISTYKENLYLTVVGLDYNECYNETIQNINVTRNDNKWVLSNVTEKIDVTELNGVIGQKLNLGDRYVGDQYRLYINVFVSDLNSEPFQVHFKESIFSGNSGSDKVIIMTNNLQFSNANDFKKMYSYNADIISEISFGMQTEIYFFSTDPNLDFGIYAGDGDKKISAVTELKDILGNNIYVSYNNESYKVYVMYQNVDVYYDSNKLVYYGK